MSIVFYPILNTNAEGEDKVDIGKGVLQAGKVALQGFAMTYGENKDHEVARMIAWLGDTSSSEKDGEVTFKYHYKCGMSDSSDHNANVEIRSLVIADLDS